MSTQTASSETRVQVRRLFSAPRERVFRAWTELEALKHWMCRDVESHQVRFLQLDVRPNGRYEIEVKTPEGVTYIGGGVYRDVKPPEKLSFTWRWKTMPEKPDASIPAEDSLVTVEFFEHGADSTDVVLTHEMLTTEESRKSHKKGWEGCFDKLAAYLKKQAQG
jgi:uncharacterized protein YndB with AHSA1/START domain